MEEKWDVYKKEREEEEKKKKGKYLMHTHYKIRANLYIDIRENEKNK